LILTENDFDQMTHLDQLNIVSTPCLESFATKMRPLGKSAIYMTSYNTTFRIPSVDSMAKGRSAIHSNSQTRESVTVMRIFAVLHQLTRYDQKSRPNMCDDAPESISNDNIASAADASSTLASMEILSITHASSTELALFCCLFMGTRFGIVSWMVCDACA